MKHDVERSPSFGSFLSNPLLLYSLWSCVVLCRSCDVAFDVAVMPALQETLAEACALPTREGLRPCLCISHQKRSRAREDSFFAGLAKRLGPGEWQMVHRRDELSVFVFAYS